MSAIGPSRRQRLAACGLSTIGMVLCVADYDIWWLAFLAWVPLWWAIEGQTPRAALFYGWLVGTATVFWGFFWLTELLVKFADFPRIAASPVALLFAAYHGLIWGFAAMIVAWLRRRAPRVSILITAPLAWVAMEAVLPNIFPIYMAQGWAWQPLWIQTAEIGGVTMVSGIMVALNTGLYCLYREYRATRRVHRPALAITAGLLVFVPAYGAVRVAQVEATMATSPHVRFGVVQGNMSIRMMSDARWKHRILMGEIEVSQRLSEQGAEVLLWGETAYPNSRIFTRQMTMEPAPGNPWRVHQGFTTPVILGAVTRDRRGRGGSMFPYNTAIYIDADGRIGDKYDKVYRLIFGEYAPLVDPVWYLSVIPGASHLEKGDGPGVLHHGDYRFGPFICYEDILPRFVREAASVGIHAFVNLTNDAWFGKTHEPAQHLGLAVFRTVEHRKPLVRAVNTGISTYVDPTGRARIKTRVVDPDVDGPQDAEGFIADVPMMDPEYRTPYGVTGELFNGLCVLGLAFIALRYREDTQGQASEPEPEPEPESQPDSDSDPDEDAEDAQA